MREISNQRSRKNKEPSSAKIQEGIEGTFRGFLQGLESRTLFSMAAANVAIFPDIALENASPSASYSTTTGCTPVQIRNAYGFSSVDFPSGSSTVAGLGQGQTIAIVDAYNDPNISADLSVFDAKYGLSAPPSFKVVNQTGGSSLPSTNGGWSGEISLDVEWAHAIAPDANILLVEASSANLGSLLAGVNYARNAPGVSVVSMSWGGGEFYGETSYDSYFTTPAGHQGVTFVAASGDSGSFYGPEWPAVSPNVVSVGGTSLDLQNSSGTYGSETAWDDSTGGTSQLEPMPAYQSAIPSSDTQLVTFSWFGGVSVTSHRSAPDVAYDADPNTGFAVYDSVPYQGYSGWEVVGGTSAGTPQWGALIAIADQGRAIKGLGSLDGASQTLPDLYSLYAAPGSAGYSTYSSAYHDITSGGSATAGYDQLTGLGSPQAVHVIAVLSSGGTASPSPTTTASAAAATTKPALGRQDLSSDTLPIAGPRPAAASFVSSPLQSWAAVEEHFALADTAPAKLVSVNVSALDAGSLGLSRLAFSASASASNDAAALGEGHLPSSAQWLATPMQNVIQTGIGMVEAVAASLPEGFAHIPAGDAASHLAMTLVSSQLVAGVAPLIAGLPGKVLGLPHPIFDPHVSSDGRAWEAVAVAGLSATLVGCWYVNAARREEKDSAPYLQPRPVRAGWELAPLEDR